MYYLIQLLFKLVYKFVPIDTVELDRMQADAEKWARAFSNKESKNKVEAIVEKYTAMWYVKLFCGILYIWLYRVIQDFMSPDGVDEEEGN